MSDKLEHYIGEYERNRALTANDPAGALRHQALDQFRELGFPDRRQENWKYTDVRKILKQDFRFSTELAGIAPGKIEPFRINEPECHELVFVNGVYSPELSRPGEFADGIVISDLASALQTHGDMLEAHLGRYSKPESSGFTALNTAFLQHGSFIHVPANLRLEKPVLLLHVSTGQAQPFTSQNRNLVILGDNAAATLIETYAGLDDAVYFTNTVAELRMNAGSHLRHYRIQQESKNSFHLGHTTVHQEQDSNYSSNVISLGAELSRTDLDCRLQAPGAETLLNGLYMVSGNQHTDHHIQVDHLCPQTRSDLNYRGILDGRGRAVFNGKAVVHKGADGTDARQSNANLLLSREAEVDTKPELEIYADDVKCSHGATVGQLDEQMLFYLRSRAIDEKTARSLLTFAFADEVVRAIDIDAVRDRLETLVAGRLPESELIREFTHE